MARALKQYLPRTMTDAFAMTLTFVLLPIAYLHGVFYVAPSLYPTSASYLTEEAREQNASTYRMHVCAMTYLLAVVLWDLVLTMVTDSSCSGITLPEMAQPGWNHCPYCKQFVPPRAFHCLTCRKCILRRDHHCFFVGQCVGYKNHSYFTLFLLHTLVASLYALILSFMLVFKLTGGFSLVVMGATIFPIVGWLLGLVEINIVMLILTSLCILVVAVSAAMLGLTLWHLYNGQTFWEAKKSIRKGNQWRRNLEDVMGSRWWLTWLCPFIPSPLPADGTHYHPRESVASRPQRLHETRGGGRGEGGGRKHC